MSGMDQLINYLKTGVLMAVLVGLLLVAGHFIGGSSGVMIALVIGLVMNVAGFFFSDKIAIAAMRAQPVGQDHELYRIVEPLAQAAGLPMPKVYLAPHEAPNAFATGRSPRHAAVCATVGLMRTLNRSEISAVMAHELAHVKHRDILIQTIATTVGAAISVLGYMQFFGMGRDNRENPLGAVFGLLVLILGPMAAGLVQMAISRRREYAADLGAAQMMGDARPMESALVKIHNLSSRVPMDVNPAFNALMIAEPKNLHRPMASMFSTPPTLEARLENLRSFQPGR